MLSLHGAINGGAYTVAWALGRPESVDVNEILLRPVGQAV